MGWGRLGGAGLLLVLAAAALAAPSGAQTASDPVAVQGCGPILEPGHYRLTADLQAGESPCLDVRADDVDLDGDGHEVAGGGDQALGIAVHAQELGPSNVTVHDVTVRGFATANVEVDGASQVRLERVTADAAATGAAGIRISAATDVAVIDSRADDGDVGVVVEDASQVRVDGTGAEGNAGDGFRFQASSTVSLTDSQAGTNGDAGVRLDEVDGAQIRRGSLRGNGVGVSVQDSSGIEVSQVALRDSRLWALEAQAGRIAFDGIGFEGWTLTGELGDGRLARTGALEPVPGAREALGLALETEPTSPQGYANLTAGYGAAEVPDYAESTVAWWRLTEADWAKVPGLNWVDPEADTVTTNASLGPVLAPTVERDVTPPNTTIQAPTGWVNGTVDVVLQARDDLSGVNRTRYRVDDAAASTYTEPVPLSSEGNHTVRYWSIDRAGNEEDPNARPIRIDQTPPSTTARIEDPILADGSVAMPANVSLEASDALSGVASTRVRIDAGDWRIVEDTVRLTEPGNHTVAFQSRDRAGNVEPVERLNVRLVESAPADGGDGTGGASAGDGPAELRVRPSEGTADTDETHVTVVNASRPESTRLVLVHPDGESETLAAGTSARWQTSTYPNGYYEVQALETGPDGEVVTLASTTHLVEHARAGPVEAALAVGTGVLVIAAARAAGGVAGRVLGWLRYLAKVVRRALGIEYRERTKEHTTLRERLRREGGAALVAAAVLATVATLSGIPDWILGPFLDRLPELGAAAVVFSLVWYGGDWLIARITGQEPRYRLLGSGLVSLGLSTILFRSPFGTPGYVRKLEQPELEGVDETTFLAHRSLADLGVITTAALVFLPAMRWISYGFGQAGLLLVVMTVATGAVPIPPLPMHQVWRWSRTAAVLAFAAGVGLYLAWQAAWLPDALLVGLGIVGVLGAAGFALRHAGSGAGSPDTARESRTS